MRELSIFVDESGDKTERSRHFIITLVFHDQNDSITDRLKTYEQGLRRSGLPNIPFHSEPLLNGHDAYKNLEMAQRKKLFSAFAALVRHLPIMYTALVYMRNNFEDERQLASRLERDIEQMLRDHLAFLQEFDQVKLYYDNGQEIVKRALSDALYSVLSKQAIVRKRATMTEYRLAQVADYLCALELAAVKYASGEASNTYEKFFGGIGYFKRNWLKQARRKRIG